MYMYQKNVIKIENSLQAIFDEIWSKTMYSLWLDFGATLKIHKKSKFD